MIYEISWIIFLCFSIFIKDLFFINIYIKQIGQVIGGLSVYLYQYKAFYKNKHVKYFGLKLIHNKADIKPKNKLFIILILIFFASFFDFLNVILEYHFSIEINGKVSKFFTFRKGVLTTIVSSLLCSCFFKF